ncbi:cell division protein ZapA [candidate division NPL-UPA2 bacterium]|nr:cell division protein ZapA [candidate division NPL-UPA2 bacterium]
MKDKLTRVKIFGTEYSLKGDEEQEYMEELSNYVDQKMREVSENSALVSTAKVAVLAALRIADELEQLRKRKSDLKTGSPVEKRIRRLIEMIDREVKD